MPKSEGYKTHPEREKLQSGQARGPHQERIYQWIQHTKIVLKIRRTPHDEACSDRRMPSTAILDETFHQHAPTIRRTQAKAGHNMHNAQASRRNGCCASKLPRSTTPPRGGGTCRSRTGKKLKNTLAHRVAIQAPQLPPHSSPKTAEEALRCKDSHPSSTR